METSTAEIDRIVREVVRRLQQRDRPTASSTTHEPATLVVAERVVTVGVLQGRLKNVRHVQVRSDAIVTPLVRDLLKDQSVTLLRASVGESADRQAANYLLIEDPLWQAESMLRQLNSGAQQWCLARDWDGLLTHLAGSAASRGVVCSPRWADRVCCANRQNVCAVAAGDVLSVDEAMQQTRVSMMIVNTNRHAEAGAIEIANRYVTLATQTK